MKRNLPYIIIIIIELIVFIGLVTYFVFINPLTKYEFNPNNREDKEFGWVSSNLHKQVESVEYNIDISHITDDKVELSKNTALEYKETETMQYALYIKDDYLGVNLSLADNHNIDIIFISSSSKAYKYRIRSNGEDYTKVIKYKDLPKGTYRIFINDNENKFDTMQYIVIE